MLYFAVALSWAQLRAMPVLQQHCGILAVLCPTCFSSLMYYIGKAAKTGHFPESGFPQWSGKQVSLCSFCGPCMDLVLLSTSSPVPSFPGQQTTNLALAMETLEVQATTSLSPGGGDLICPCRKWERASAVWNKKVLSTIMSQSSHGKDTLTNHTQRSCNSTCIGQFPQWNWAWQWGKKKKKKISLLMSTYRECWGSWLGLPSVRCPQGLLAWWAERRAMASPGTCCRPLGACNNGHRSLNP